ncbi:hypothetical protein SAMN05443667_102278 [Flavobacterium gillisiae]|uniref:WG containing repeat-containing protein n=1 Tax=Flavobacterium gillisiae TaxID=150146 RepID=A0A1H3Z6G2_9FLAO|nr:hypothetical protein [Flavobacterium gillisiae]SEA19265.1 hypothetical protein SAMN05443667_102278 [Flavobacterium gillisiae]
MKKPFFYFLMLSSLFVNAQTTIVEERFEKDKTPMRYHYLPKSGKIVIEKGSYVSMSTNRRINNITSYDSNGKIEIVADQFEIPQAYFSVTENTFKVDEFTRAAGAKKYNYYVNGKQTPFISYSDVDRNFWISNKYNVNSSFGRAFFNDKYELDIVDEKGKNKVIFEKDEFYLETLDIFSKEKRIIPIVKPDISRLVGKGFINVEEYLGYTANIIDNDKFEIVTKSISKDYKSSILYRTFYSMEGKNVGEQKIDISLPKEYLAYSANKVARINEKLTGFKNETELFLTDIGINDFIEDNVTKDVYVYGLFADKPKKLNDDNSPMGYYIFKFDKDGNKLWESINRIEDKDDFNKKIHLVKVFSSLSFSDNELCMQTGGAFTNKYFHYCYLDKKTGNIVSKGKISYEKDRIYTMSGDVRLFLFSFYENKDYKKKLFDLDGLIAIDKNKKVADYLKSINNKNKLYFNTILGNEGTWLIESDNEEYYKVTFFKA